MRMRIIGLALSLCLLLTACGGTEQDSGDQAPLLGRAAGLDEAAVLMTVDGREIPAWRYLCWLAYTCDQIAEQYAAAGTPLRWSDSVTGGTLADYVRDQALADTVLYAVVEAWAEQYGCQSGETEEEETVFPDLREDQRQEMAAVGTMYAWLWQLYQTPDSALAPTETALTAFAAERGIFRIDRFLAGGEDREAARQRAAEAFAKINGAEDQAAVFTQLAAGADDPAGPRTVSKGDGALDPALEEAALALEVGQCSGILSSGEGFSILRRLPPETEALREAHFDHLLECAAAEAAVEVTEDYAQLEVETFYTALLQMRAAEGDPSR